MELKKLTYEEEYALQEELLNKIDLRPYIKLHMKHWEIADAIQDAYEDHEFPTEINSIVEAPPFNGYITNLFDNADLMEYLEKYYGTRFTECSYYEVTREIWNE